MLVGYVPIIWSSPNMRIHVHYCSRLPGTVNHNLYRDLYSNNNSGSEIDD